ncbi:hypothetical protein PHYBLDRAFT_73953 [Phycomyces blakesleeanus NRRL 1555(-)]|uniref:Uncharacterized protein n=1 Tax=Phycomyces blakesleeanus (strain ATCC 8743b / DSM 1359 / FGSC 10004 / NBRC 33097 / NRRL 1555) TaxID=763407 RepID=A0A167JKJ3_PHYB8|nr:hypothetical protein PHYBLDRAFT_73953 [Phycomyces blakesleeanus NRRL 1555(-)]OAD66186.1 hypothetical protein PHYBLDRAFT_73953 [Phycomyces blakesleeanus NRRL 1555(-)]|eukprot:XP_018284226.1 hypothetical protein PHYBLDRAFT_73953 [Phycomyces blakesleeanus NRRL 1555(-)]
MISFKLVSELTSVNKIGSYKQLSRNITDALSLIKHIDSNVEIRVWSQKTLEVILENQKLTRYIIGLAHIIQTIKESNTKLCIISCSFNIKVIAIVFLLLSCNISQVVSRIPKRH